MLITYSHKSRRRGQSLQQRRRRGLLLRTDYSFVPPSLHGLTVVNQWCKPHAMLSLSI